MGNVRLYGATSGYTELAPPAVAPDGVLSLPSGTGTIATQSYVDTSSAAAGGLVHINTTTFTAVSSVSLDDVFSADYENYKIIMTLFNSSTALTYMRLRASGSDLTSTTYSFAVARISSQGSLTATNWGESFNYWQALLAHDSANIYQSGEYLITKPFIAERTCLLYTSPSPRDS